MVRRLGLGKTNHLTYASLALNPRYALHVIQSLVCCRAIQRQSVKGIDKKKKKTVYLFLSTCLAPENKER